jgi:hypothetical protein
MARRPNVTLHVLPADGRHTPARGGFQLITKHGDIEPFMVVDFGADGPRYLERPEQGAMFLDIYDYVRGIALSPTDSARRIDDIRESYR